MLGGAVSVLLATIPAAPVVALMGAGVIITLAGHIVRIKGIIATGLAILFLATAGLIAAAFVAYQQDPGDPRPCTIAGC
jgi:hypothetical protein